MKATYLVVTSLFIAGLSGCGIGGMAGPFPGHPDSVSASNNNRPKVKPAAPQVVYRIDENRFFEVIPITQYQCSGTLYYTDTVQAIHQSVAGWNEISRGNFIIDAANSDYLVGPILPARGDCAADTANRPSCSSRLPYSTDGGRSWKYVPTVYSGSIWVSKSTVYVMTAARSIGSLDLSQDNLNASNWKYGSTQEIPTAIPRAKSFDTQFRCNRNLEN